ncbi:MAG: glycerol-3-phosphate acyltransferase [Chloroflexi bacterium]|nr:glycerol-3-phosphate acyltransferase [Chloroflexota bacterium]
MDIVLSLVLAYLLGSIPFAYIIGRLSGLDVRKVGDRNVGTFNVFRHAGLVAGIATLIADVGKGALAILVAKVLSGHELVVFGAGVAAVIGHNWPVFLRFRGGRGLAVVIGVLLALLPREMVISAAIAIAVLFATKNSVWFGVALFIPLVLLCWFFGEPVSLLIYSVALPCSAGFTHWLTTRHLPPEAQKEAVSFWIARKAGRENK